MPNNLHISYDLAGPDRDYAAVIARIKELGNWAKIEFSFFYVNSQLSASDARNHVWTAMRTGDKLYVVDATNNNASWIGLPAEVTALIQAEWDV